MPTDETWPYPSFADMRPYHPDQISFMGQAWHTTEERTYNDTINLLILKESPHATMRAFSISQIGGVSSSAPSNRGLAEPHTRAPAVLRHQAYGDAGQNYKNIAGLVKSLTGMPFVEVSNEGCPPPSAAGGDGASAVLSRLYRALV